MTSPGKADATEMAASQGGAIALTAAPTRIALQPAGNVDLAAAFAAAPARHFILTLQGLATDRPPETGYLVFLNVPEGVTPAVEDIGYAGAVSFFGVPPSAEGADARAVSFEVSEVVQRLRAAGRLAERDDGNDPPGGQAGGRKPSNDPPARAVRAINNRAPGPIRISRARPAAGHDCAPASCMLKLHVAKPYNLEQKPTTLEEIMRTLSRRALLGASAFGGLIPSLLLDSRRAGAATRIRHDLTTTDGQKNIKIYAKGFELIMKLPERDPRGWLFQWYTHAVRDDRTKASEISRVYGSASSPDKQLAQDAWNTCQPHNPPFSSDMFLPWHRMFVLCLEEIVRQITKEDAFTLPYWNYTQAGQRALPAEFRKKGDPTWGSLYRTNRITQVNAGTPIDQVPGSTPFDLSAMKFNVYSGGAGFCANLDNNPHGIVHDDIGNGQGMGSVPWAANDPIFWIHHCNIDHIWASWNKAGGKNPALTGTYTFADRDGKKVVLDVAKFLDTLTQGYEYDKYLPRPPGSLPFPPADKLVVAFALHATTAQTSGPVSLGAAPISVTLAAAPPTPGAPAPTRRLRAATMR